MPLLSTAGRSGGSGSRRCGVPPAGAGTGAVSVLLKQKVSARAGPHLPRRMRLPWITACLSVSLCSPSPSLHHLFPSRCAICNQPPTGRGYFLTAAGGCSLCLDAGCRACAATTGACTACLGDLVLNEGQCLKKGDPPPVNKTGTFLLDIPPRIQFFEVGPPARGACVPPPVPGQLTRHPLPPALGSLIPPCRASATVPKRRCRCWPSRTASGCPSTGCGKL